MGALLTEPLAYAQSAPPGFLAVEKLSAALFGPSEYSLRFFPLLCSVAGLLLFAKLVQERLPRGSALAALAICAISGPLIVGAATLKQYSADTLCTSLLLLAATRASTRRTVRDSLALGVVVALAVLFSQPAAIVFGAIACVLVGVEVRRIRVERAAPDWVLLGALLFAGLVTAGSAAHALHALTPETNEYLRAFWEQGFLPTHLPGSLSEAWPYAQLSSFFDGSGLDGAAYPLPGLFAALTALGLVLLPMRNGLPGALVAAPAAAALLASAARAYPLGGRAMLYLHPVFLIAIATAVEALTSLVGRYRKLAGLASLWVLVGLAVFPVVRRPPPYHREHLRPVAQFVASHRRPDEPLYVYYGLAPAFSFYGPRFALTGAETVIGTCHRGDPRRYLAEVDRFRGSRRVWLLLGHSLPRFQEREQILRYLDSIGTRKSSFSEPGYGFRPVLEPVDAYEYDLSDLRKGGAASAATFPVVREEQANAAFPCGSGPQSIR